jgi:hypothetical protein
MKENSENAKPDPHDVRAYHAAVMIVRTPIGHRNRSTLLHDRSAPPGSDESNAGSH